MAIDKELEKRVIAKRDMFLSKIEKLGLGSKRVSSIEKLAFQMELENLYGEKEVAFQIKEEVKNIITEGVNNK